MEERPDQRANAQGDEPVAFSFQVGGDQPAPATPATPAASPSAPPPLTPAPSGPQMPQQAQQMYPPPGVSGYPITPGAPGGAGPQFAVGYGHERMPPLPPPPPVMMPSQTPRRQPRGPLGRPFPLPTTLLVALGALVALALVFGVRVLFGGDWAEGASAVGIVALALAGVTVLVALLRVAAGRRSLVFALLTLVLLVALAGAGVAGLAGGTSLHLAQAKALEQSGQWGDAIRQYRLGGQKGPNAPDIARVQNAWGNQLLKQGNYQDALDHFQTVLDDYSESGTAVNQARQGEFLVFVAWMKEDPNHVPYREAVTTFVNFASSADCDSDCRTTIDAVAPQAYYLYGVQLLDQKNYQLAITEFTKLTSQYASSPYTTQAHGKAATAYLAYGQQQISGQNCSGAVTTYKTLVANYKDTPEAAKAQTALKAPQDVTGLITNAPKNPPPTVHLSKQMNFKTFFFSDEYTTSLNASTGAYTFKLVAQGTYYITTSRPVSDGVDYVAWRNEADTGFYSFTVTPLCTVKIDTLSY
jgi:TolA-binding protein